MATSTETSEGDDTERSSTAAESTGEQAGQGGLRARAMTQVKNGRLPMAVGAIMAVRGVRGMLSKEGSGLAQTVAGLGLLGFGLRRRSRDESSMIDIPLGGDDDDVEDDVPGSETVALRAQSNRPGKNPRDVDDESDAPATHDPDQGAVQFETDEGDDLERKPHIDDIDPKDPRYPDEGDPETDDEHVDVDISESALADEPNEAVGPDEEQAYPAVEGTDPEPSAAQSPEQAEGEVTDDEDATTDPDFEELSDESTEDESAGVESDDAESADADEEGTDSDDATEAEASDEDTDEDEEN